MVAGMSTTQSAYNNQLFIVQIDATLVDLCFLPDIYIFYLRDLLFISAFIIQVKKLKIFH